MMKLLHELPLIVGFISFSAINVYLWSRVISQELLCAFAAVLGAFYFAGMMWHVSRDPPKVESHD